MGVSREVHALTALSPGKQTLNTEQIGGQMEVSSEVHAPAVLSPGKETLNTEQIGG
jgi:hypothetical protein